jgi:hypothetical protein
MAKKRRIFEPGHGRKLMVIVDESPEVEGALFYAAGRVMHAGGRILLLYVIEPDNQFWEGVRRVQLRSRPARPGRSSACSGASSTTRAERCPPTR